jgi:hypothetical protein
MPMLTSVPAPALRSAPASSHRHESSRVRASVTAAVLVLAGATAAHGATYPNGFVWSLVSDYDAGTQQGGSIGRGNPALDAEGVMAWSYEWLPAGAPLGLPIPAWYTAPSTLLVWDAPSSLGSPAWSKSDDSTLVVSSEPAASRAALVHVPGSVDAKPLVRWTNPLGRDAAVRVSDFITLQWVSGASGSVDVVIALWDRSAGAFVPLFSSTVQRPESGNVAIIGPELPQVNIGSGDSLVLSVSGNGLPIGEIVTLTDLRITLLSGGACPGDADGDRTVQFFDITSVLANFGAACP